MSTHDKQDEEEEFGESKKAKKKRHQTQIHSERKAIRQKFKDISLDNLQDYLGDEDLYE